MTTMLETEVDSDPYLIALVRGGDTDAYGRLYERHVASARRLARVLVPDPSDAEDLVAETFTRVLAALRAGYGPDTAFRAYLLTTLRHALYDRARRDRRVEYTDDLTPYERTDPPEDPAVKTLESAYAARAFARLPERWRAVLWHTEVEGESPAQVAPLLGLTPNGVAALAYRARERLRQMYLQEHIAVTESPRCHWTGTHLAGYVRAALARRDRSKVEDHLTECERCRVLHRELTEENSGLRGVLAGLLLGGSAPAYLAETGHFGGGWLAASGAALLLWGKGLLAEAGALAAGTWWLLRTLPGRLVARYGPGNVAAAGGLAGAGLAGVSVFTVLALQGPAPQHQAVPVPALSRPVQPPATGRAQLIPPTPSPVRAPTLAPLLPGQARQPPPAAPSAPPAGPVAPTPVVPAIAFDPARGSLAAQQKGTLPITVRQAGSPAAGREPALATIGKAEQILLRLKLPQGVRLAGADAGDGWQCAGAIDEVSCARSGPPHPGSTAEIPLEVGDLTGYQGFRVTASFGAASTESLLRVPIAPAGLHVGYAATGRAGYALAGNTLLSCLPRPACLSADNNGRAMLPALPTLREAQAPPGLLELGGSLGPSGLLPELAGAKAASGARLVLPGAARVRWAGLTVTTSAEHAPSLAAVHGPGGGWYPIKLKPTGRALSDRPVAASFAEVTDLVRQGGAGDWWTAVAASGLPLGLGHFAGWSLIVVYEAQTLATAELAVYMGPRPLRAGNDLSWRLGTSGPIDVGLVIWDGDSALEGDSLLVGGRAVGNPKNLAAGRNSSAISCANTPESCSWPSPGLDVLRFRETAEVGETVALSAGEDPLELGALVVLAETAQAPEPSQN